MTGTTSKLQFIPLLMAVAIACSSCGSDHSSADLADISPSVATSETSSTVTNVAIAPQPVTLSTPLAAVTEAETTSQKLYQAWKAGDRATALKTAEPTAVSRLFSHPSSLPNLQFRVCENRQAGSDCFYSFEGGGMKMQVKNNRVATVDFVALPGGISDPAVAAKQLYSAWKAGDRVNARKSSSETALNQLFKQPWSAPDLKFTGCENHAGGYDCFYRYEGGGLMMRVEGGASAGYWVQSINFVAD